MTRATLETPYGAFQFVLHEDRAPSTCAYFLSVLRSERYAEASIFRIVAPVNYAPDESNPIEVIQLGPRGCLEGSQESVPHESTEATGLRHRRGTVSTARINLNHAFGSFFICLRDEPALDYGANRHPDHQGFAAFGQIESGFETLERIFAQAEATDFLEREIPILSVAIDQNEVPER